MDTYFNPVRIIRGPGALRKLPSLVSSAVAPEKKILLLVWNECVLTLPGIEELQKFGHDHVVTRTFSASNPELEQLWRVYQETRKMNIGLVVAVGGGSVLDVGKSLCCLQDKELSSAEDLRQMIAWKTYDEPACRWIGVPTTAGTGSEVTCWATIWDSENNVKYSIDTPKNYAFAAVVDPQATGTMPIGLAVASALDAAAHAMESYWANSRNAVSRALALEAVRTVMGNIDLLLADSTSQEAHNQMAKGSMLAGLAFSNTRTTACHSISYPLTMRHRIPHGVAVSLLLGPVLELNLPAIQNAEALLYAFGVERPEHVGPRIAAILKAAGYPARLREWRITADEIPDLAAHGITKGRADNNPVELTERVAGNILKSIW